MDNIIKLITIIGLVLAIICIPIDAFVLSVLISLFHITDIFTLYFAWSISASVSAFIILFPCAYLIKIHKPLLIGTFSGMFAVATIIFFSIMNKLPLTIGNYFEYISLIIFSAAACYLGSFTKSKMKD